MREGREDRKAERERNSEAKGRGFGALVVSQEWGRAGDAEVRACVRARAGTEDGVRRVCELHDAPLP